MDDRRQLFRNRVYYGGELAFNGRTSTLTCIVRNFSARGAKIEIEGSAVLPDKLDFTVERKGLSCLARLVWRSRAEAGLVFTDPHAADAIVPLDWARKLAASERTNRRLQSRIEQLRAQY
ncbi:PilZ domain-containing protein [Bradyrhizobium sp.]|uniref:PilZ domain-containing protein n=1 Tax=Bradyrhizobium sp. TaxID=376 RepID=UPI001EBCD2A8|nr:PilZ domain-containing protein [Bradyrhizobium sp.]MBV9983230.1 PilZ domain-containing protein [Bradyrhizobium sp.]